MGILLWILGILAGLVALVVILFLVLWVRSIWVSVKRDDELSKKTEPVISALSKNEAVDLELVDSLSADPLTRVHFLGELVELGKDDLFPAEYKTLEMIAESDMVRWLSHGNELGSAPSEIEMVFEHEVFERLKCGRCFLFKFRVPDSHWASKNGWMCGVSGPFWEGENALMGQHTFSELQSYTAMTHEEHLSFLAHYATKLGWSMPNPVGLA